MGYRELQELLEQQHLSDEIAEVSETERGLVYSVSFEPRPALSCWQPLRQAVSYTGYWPVISEIYDPQRSHSTTFDMQAECQSSVASSFVTLLDEVLHIRAQETIFQYDALLSLYQRLQSEPIEFLPDVIDDPNEELAQFPHDWRDFDPAKPDIPNPAQDFAARLHFYPVLSSWQIPILIRYSDFIDCPDSVTHAAVFRYWEELYDAELMVMGYGWIGHWVQHPPIHPAQAARVAWEHMSYANLHYIPLGRYAAGLTHAKMWVFDWEE